MDKKRVLITGIDGFIGSHLSRYLMNKGISVAGTVLDMSKIDRLRDLTSLELFEANILDSARMREIIEKTNPEHIFHLAGMLKNKGSLHDEIEQTLDLNVKATVGILDICKNRNLDSFIFPSTLEVYGNNSVPFLESQREDPITPYSLSKLFAEKYCQYYHCAFNVPTKIIRFPVLYGPSQDSVMLVPLIINQILHGNQIKLYSNGLQTRDFLYVDDAVEGLFKLATCSSASGKIQNICFGGETQLKKLVVTLEAIVGRSADIQFIPENFREQEIMRYVGDNSMAKRLLDWKPKYSLEEGLKQTVESYK